MPRVLIAILTGLVAAVLPFTTPAAAQEQTERVLVRLAGPPAQALDRVVDELVLTDVEPDRMRTYRAIPWVAMELSADGVDVLERSRAVADVVRDEVATLNVNESVGIVDADDATAAGFDGTGQRVAVLDTGVDTAHPWFADRIAAEACFSGAAGTSLCPGGVRTVTGSGAGAACTGVTGCYHGTHVAGIAAKVAPEAAIVAVQVFSQTSGGLAAYTSDVVAAMDWIHANRATLNVAAVNLSLGTTTLYSGTDACDTASPTYNAAVDALAAVGIATVAASGNASSGTGSTTSIASPGCVSGAISVGSTNKSPEAMSAFGHRAPFLSVVAPGASITSAMPGGGTGILSGTSMATPHVAGAVAQLKEAAPAATVDELLAGLRATATTVDGFPRISVHSALKPTAPQALTATIREDAVDVAWTAPEWSGPVALSGYELTYHDGSSSPAAADTTSALPRVPNGSQISLVAKNSIGSSPAATVTVMTAPGAPTGVSAVGGNRSAVVSWTAPADAGGGTLTGYRVTGSSDGADPDPVTVAGDATAASIGSLTNGVAYTFTVEAVNAAGASPASVASAAVTPAPTAPLAPTGVAATAGDGTATVSWTAPADDGGSALTGYRVVPSDGATPTVTTTSTSATFAGLTNGTSIAFTVHAANDVGESTGAMSAAVTPTAPAPAPAPEPAPAPAPQPAPAPAPAPVPTRGSGGGGGGGGMPPTTSTSTTSTTVKPPSTNRTPVKPPTTTTTTAPPPSSPAAATVPGGVLTLSSGVPTLVPIAAPSGQTVVGGAATPSGKGAWVVTATGDITATGDAEDHGDLTKLALNQPVVGMASTQSGDGYWLLGADGGIFSFGDAAFHGSTGAMRLNQPITTMASTPTGRGYWLLARDGGVFTFGDARFHGSTGAMVLNQPINAMASTPSNKGYWLVAGDGGVFTFGDAAFHGAGSLGRRVVALAATTTGRGYWLLAADGSAIPYGDARR